MKINRQRDSLRRPLFTARTTHAIRLALLVSGATAATAALVTYEYFHSPYWNRVGIAPDQPIPFSHRHHVGELRIDCRFCHASVETGASASLPSTQTCLTCHSQLFPDAAMLQPLHASAAENVPLVWSRVNNLPDHVHFNHSIHIAKSIACVSCHGEVGDMALTAKARALTMWECLACHRNPAPQQVAPDRLFTSRAISDEKNHSGREEKPLPVISARVLTDCSTCHH